MDLNIFKLLFSHFVVEAMPKEILLLVYANSIGADQTAHMRSLLSTFAIHFRGPKIGVCVVSSCSRH